MLTGKILYNVSSASRGREGGREGEKGIGLEGRGRDVLSSSLSKSFNFDQLADAYR